MFVKPTKLEDAKKKLIETISLKNETVKIPIVNSLDRVNCSTIKSEINLPSTNRLQILPLKLTTVLDRFKLKK